MQHRALYGCTVNMFGWDSKSTLFTMLPLPMNSQVGNCKTRRLWEYILYCIYSLVNKFRLAKVPEHDVNMEDLLLLLNLMRYETKHNKTS